LIQACQVNPACTYACCKPAENIPGLIEELETFITTYEIQQKNDNNILFTDRHYYRQTPPYPISKQTPSRNPPSQETSYGQTIFRRPPGRQTISKKRCFVCRNEGCWSSNHSKEEQEESKRRYRSKILQHYDRNTRQYITGYEGTEQEEETYDNEFEEETLDDTIQTLMTDSESLPPIEEQSEQFFTSLGKVQNESAMEIVAKLADRAFTHALTGAKPSTKTEATKGVISPWTATGLTTPEAPESITSYIATTRYTPNKFYGVVINTGASQKSTAGYNQFLAYGKTYPMNIDTTRAGQVTVQFGIGGISSQTPIGDVEFHVV
jgi:hypothetical protein